MVITGARVAVSPVRARKLNLWLCEGLISFLPIGWAETLRLDLQGFMVLPGLINAHDHLELNLFPKLGCGPYKNSSDWAKDVYRPHEPPVRQHLAVPKTLRLRWGGMKNLISGVTTVAHHNDLHPAMLDVNFPVRVVNEYGWAHSLHFSPDWETRFRNTPVHYPFVIHAAEGTDEQASGEVGTLAEAGVLDSRTIVVHGVGVRSCDVPGFTRSKASIVWCPSSNHFMLTRSLDSSVLDSGIPIALGTDSAMTGHGDLLDEARVAVRSVDACRVYRMVTTDAARMFKLPSGFGRVCHGGPADLLIMPDGGQSPAITLLENFPQLVIVRGTVKLVSVDIARHCPPEIFQPLRPIEVEGRGRYLVDGDIASLLSKTKRILQEAPRLAGKAIAA
jgi:cytosine/adenosine deaminase-related metal-dependent hydrolase